MLGFFIFFSVGWFSSFLLVFVWFWFFAVFFASENLTFKNVISRKFDEKIRCVDNTFEFSFLFSVFVHMQGFFET